MILDPMEVKAEALCDLYFWMMPACDVCFDAVDSHWYSRIKIPLQVGNVVQEYLMSIELSN